MKYLLTEHVLSVCEDDAEGRTTHKQGDCGEGFIKHLQGQNSSSADAPGLQVQVLKMMVKFTIMSLCPNTPDKGSILITNVISKWWVS